MRKLPLQPPVERVADSINRESKPLLIQRAARNLRSQFVENLARPRDHRTASIGADESGGVLASQNLIHARQQTVQLGMCSGFQRWSPCMKSYPTSTSP